MTANNSKRTAKSKSSANPTNYSKLYKQSDENVAQNVSTAAPIAAASTAQRTSAEVDWRTEYGFVFSDLRKLFIVSGILFAAIIVLGFFF